MEVITAHNAVVEDKIEVVGNYEWGAAIARKVPQP